MLAKGGPIEEQGERERVVCPKFRILKYEIIRVRKGKSIICAESWEALGGVGGGKRIL